MGCFHLLKVMCCGQTSRETGKLLKSSLEFFFGGCFVSGEGIRFFCFSLAIGEEIRILGTLLLSGINVFKRAGRETRNAS